MLLFLLTATALAAPVPLNGAEVARHDQPGDCWMIIDGTVYDLTGWIAAHPGGDAILRGCGKDASWFFHNRDDAGGHSAAAGAMLAEHALGPVGAEIDLEIARPEPVHPHAARLEGTRTGLLPTAGVGPRKSVALRVAHNFSGESDILSQVGYSFGRLDVLLSDARGLGLGGLEVRGQPLRQPAGAPLSLTALGGGGFAAALDAPALYGQLVAEREALDRRLSVRGVGTVSAAPGAAPAQFAAGAGLEFRPIPIHSVFAELNVPVTHPDALSWSAGARLFTRSHMFALYGASITDASPWSLAGPSGSGFAVGASMERAFRLGG